MFSFPRFQDIPLCRTYRLVEFRRGNVRVQDDCGSQAGPVVSAVGMSSDGAIEVLGVWPAEGEGTPWTAVLEDLMARGVVRISFACGEGVDDAIEFASSSITALSAMKLVGLVGRSPSQAQVQILAMAHRRFHRFLRRHGCGPSLQSAVGAATVAWRRDEVRGPLLRAPRHLRGARASTPVDARARWGKL